MVPSRKDKSGKAGKVSRTMTSALDNSIGKVVEESKLELVSLLESGLIEAEKILRDSELDARSETKKIIQSADRLAESRARQILGRAEIESRNKTLRLIEEKTNEAFTKALEDLRAKKGKGYLLSLRKMIVEGIDSINAKKVIVRCNEEDKANVIKISEEISKERRADITVSDKPLRSSGGVEVRNIDGTVSLRNTFEDRLERMKPQMRRDLANTFLS